MLSIMIKSQETSGRGHGTRVMVMLDAEIRLLFSGNEEIVKGAIGRGGNGKGDRFKCPVSSPPRRPA